MVFYLSEELHAFQMLHHVSTAGNDCFRGKGPLYTQWSTVSVCLPNSRRYTILPCQPPSLLRVPQNTGQSLSHHHAP